MTTSSTRFVIAAGIALILGATSCSPARTKDKSAAPAPAQTAAAPGPGSTSTSGGITAASGNKTLKKITTVAASVDTATNLKSNYWSSVNLLVAQPRLGDSDLVIFQINDQGDVIFPYDQAKPKDQIYPASLKVKSNGEAVMELVSTSDPNMSLGDAKVQFSTENALILTPSGKNAKAILFYPASEELVLEVIKGPAK